VVLNVTALAGSMEISMNGIALRLTTATESAHQPASPHNWSSWPSASFVNWVVPAHAVRAGSNTVSMHAAPTPSEKQYRVAHTGAVAGGDNKRWRFPFPHTSRDWKGPRITGSRYTRLNLSGCQKQCDADSACRGVYFMQSADGECYTVHTLVVGETEETGTSYQRQVPGESSSAAGVRSVSVADLSLIYMDVSMPHKDQQIASTTRRLATDDVVPPTASPQFRGSYANIMKVTDPSPRPLTVQSVLDWGSDDLNATVQALLETNQNLWGIGISDCEHWQALPGLLRLTHDTPLRVFALISSHHPLSSFCSLWRDNNGTGNLSYTRVATTLAALAAAEPHLVAFTVDDFFVGQTQPGPPGGQGTPAHPLPTGGTQSRTVIVDMMAQMKHVNPDFQFWPTVYYSQLGVAFKGGFFLGATDLVPFDVNTTATVQLNYTGLRLTEAAGHTAVLSFKYLCAFCPPGTESSKTTAAQAAASNALWRDRIFMRVVVGNETILDVDMLALPLHPYGGQRFSRDIASLLANEAHNNSALTFEMYAQDAHVRNIAVHKMANIFMLSLVIDGNEVVGTKSLTSRLWVAPAAGASKAEAAQLVAVRSDEYAVPMDGMLNPYPMVSLIPPTQLLQSAVCNALSPNL
jgi:hypothetical protein